MLLLRLPPSPSPRLANEQQQQQHQQQNRLTFAVQSSLSLPLVLASVCLLQDVAVKRLVFKKTKSVAEAIVKERRIWMIVNNHRNHRPCHDDGCHSLMS